MLLFLYEKKNEELSSEFRIPKKFKNLIFPLLDDSRDNSVDILALITAIYLIVACIVYYAVIFSGILPVKAANLIWFCMLIGVGFLMLGLDLVRMFLQHNLAIIIISWIIGVIFALIGILTIFFSIWTAGGTRIIA